MRRLSGYLPVLLWMAMIFTASTDLGSVQKTSLIIGPIVRWFNPEVSEETIYAVQAFVRKSAHVTVYAVLAMLFWRGRRVARGTKPVLSSWEWRETWLIVLWCGLYAVTDELHQAFVSTRQGNIFDVLLDSTGALGGLVIIWAIGRWRKRW